MISRVSQRAFDRLCDSRMVTMMGLPPRHPNDDDQENEEDEDDDGDEEGEAAVIREPDEC
jgi:hypothetical protein